MDPYRHVDNTSELRRSTAVVYCHDRQVVINIKIEINNYQATWGSQDRRDFQFSQLNCCRAVVGPTTWNTTDCQSAEYLHVQHIGSSFIVYTNKAATVRTATTAATHQHFTSELRTYIGSSNIMLIKGTSLCWASFVGCQQDSTHICCWAPAPAARRPQLSIDTSCPQGAQQQTRWSPLLRSIDGTDRRKDGRPIPLHVKRPCPAFDFANFWGGGRACDGRMIASTKTKTFILTENTERKQTT